MSDRELLPPNATPQEIALAGAVSRISNIPLPIRDLRRSDTCPEALLPWLAWTFSLDEWSADWTPEQKRASIANSVFLHRHKGTIGAVRGALAALGVGARVQEWFNQTPRGAPYTYKLLLDVDQVGIGRDDVLGVDAVVNSAKNLRSHLDKIELSVATNAGAYIGAVASAGTEISVMYQAADPLLIEAAYNGYVETERAVDALHLLLNTTMPTSNYW